MSLQDIEWWKNKKDGEPVTVAILKLDLVDSTDLHERLKTDPEKHNFCFRTYHDTVEDVLLGFGSCPITWNGDGTTGYFEGEYAIIRATKAGLQALERLRITPPLGAEWELRIRVAIGIDEVVWDHDPGKIPSSEFNIAGHVEKACPARAVVLTEEAYLALESEPSFRDKFIYLGTTKEDAAPCYVSPAWRKTEKKADLFIPEIEDDHGAREQMRAFYYSPPFRQIRFTEISQFQRLGGVDLLDAFVSPRVRPIVSSQGGELVQVKSSAGEVVFKSAQKKGPIHFVSMALPQTFSMVFRNEKSIVILGGPGSGKTTLLRWLALVAMRGRRELKRELGAEKKYLPIFAPLSSIWEVYKNHNKEYNLLETIDTFFRTMGVAGIKKTFEKAYESEEAVFLLDGLDEIAGAADRVNAARWVETFAATHYKARFIVTSRIAGFVGLNLLSGKTYELQPLGAEEAESLAYAFYTAFHHTGKITLSEAREPAKKDTEALISELKDKESFHPFLANPLLLTIAAMVHGQLGKLPSSRVLLYDVAAQTLVEAWAQNRRPEAVNSSVEKVKYKGEAARIFMSLALWMLKRDMGPEIHEDELVDQIAKYLSSRPSSGEQEEAKEAVRTFLRKIECGGAILALKEGFRTWSFLHRTFLEFFAAMALATDDKERSRCLKKSLYDPDWEEVWRLVAADLSIRQRRTKDAEDFVKKIYTNRDAFEAGLLRKNLLLSAKCLGDMPSADGISRKIAEELARLLLHPGPMPPPQAVTEAARVFCAGSSRAFLIERLKAKLESGGETERLNVFEALLELGYRDIPVPVEIVKKMLLHGKEKMAIQRHAIDRLMAPGAEEEAAALSDKKNPTLELVKLLRDKDIWTRVRAADVLPRLGAIETVPDLIKAFKNEKDRRAAFSIGRAIWALSFLRRPPRISKGARKKARKKDRSGKKRPAR